MNRRQFIQSIALLPLIVGCAAPTIYDRAKHGRLTRVGVIAYPHRIRVLTSREWNMYSQAGENDALTGKLIKMLGSRCDRFGALMRETMTTVLSRHGIKWKEIAYRDDGGMLNPIYRTPKYKDAGEPLYFESQISLCYSRIGDSVVPGAGTFNRLVTPEGDVLWGSAISIGPSFFPQSTILAMPAARYKDIYEVIEGSPDQAAATLMALATPLGSATGELLLSATASK